MKTIHASTEVRNLARSGIFLAMVALMAGVVNCVYPPPFIPEYDLTISSTEGGSVTTPGEGTLDYSDQEVVELVAEAYEGHEFAEWSGEVGTIADVNAANTTITMSDDYAITANFIAQSVLIISSAGNFMAQCELTISSTAGGNVTEPGEKGLSPMTKERWSIWRSRLRNVLHGLSTGPAMWTPSPMSPTAQPPSRWTMITPSPPTSRRELTGLGLEPLWWQRR
jgi:hypothetical protein